MIKIAKVEAFQGMDDIDFKVMDHELYDLFHSDGRNGREMTQQFFADEENIFLKVYWDGKEVQTIAFGNKAG